MIIDSHTHIGKFGDMPAKTPEELLYSMDEAKIDISLVISNQFSNETEGLSTKEAIRIGEQFPRLKIVGNIDYSKLDEAQIAELIEFLKAKKIVGVKLYTGYEYFYPNDQKLHPLYEFCSQNDFPVIFHQGVLVQGSAGLLKYSHPLAIDELAQNFPNLKIIIAHFGNPWLRDCGVVVIKNKNVYVDFSGYFTEYALIQKSEKNVFQHELRWFKYFIGSFRKCLFGTDWPLYSQRDYLKAVQSLPMTKEEKDLVFWKNAKTLFKI